MSHLSQRAFLGSCAGAFPQMFRDAAILEIGSGDINGSTRRLFSHCEYVGVDVVPGAGVDVVGSGHEVKFDKQFDVALSCECFEHNPYWRETLANIIAHLRPGGMLIITCAAPGRPEHGTSRSLPNYSLSVQLQWDYYRNVSPAALAEAVLNSPKKVVFRIFHRRSEADLYLVGFVGSDPVARALAEFAPKWQTDKSIPMRLFLMAGGVLESIGLVTPHLLFKSLTLLQRGYSAAKSALLTR